MKELFKKWRGDEGRHMEGVHCAAELEAWLVSLWTEITDDPATWPRGVVYLSYYGEQHHGRFGEWNGSAWKGHKWRPIIPGIDTP